LGVGGVGALGGGVMNARNDKRGLRR
jgi:hypothetical protein